MTHFRNLMRFVGDLPTRTILDIGAGKGGFLLEAAREGVRAEGIEYNPAYIQTAYERAQAAGLSISVRQGRAEELPFRDGSFGFINLGEVIEHVDDPEQVLREVFRVLTPDGVAYVSVPARFSLRDPHYHVYGVNWVPRAWSDTYLALVGVRKADDGSAGHQRLADMHYYRFKDFAVLAKRIGFAVQDSREERIRALVPGPLALPALLLYRAIARPVLLDTAHVLLTKQAS